jgi:hypothetical protein
MNLRGSLVRILETARPTFRRFWVAVLLCVAATLTLSAAVTGDLHKNDQLVRWSLALFSGILAAWCAILYWERRYSLNIDSSAEGSAARPEGSTGTDGNTPPHAGESPWRNQELTANLMALPVAGLIVGATFLLLHEFGVVSMSRHFAICVVLSLTCFVAPHFRRKGSLEMYIVRLFSHAFVSALFAAILFLGLVAITFTVSSLFSLNVTYRAYIRIFLVMAVTVAPFLFMGGIPRGTIGSDTADYPKVLKNLVLFVITPLLTAYTLILYVYFAKILLTRVWPVGLVAHLVLWYSMAGAAILYFIWPLEGDNKWGRAFSSYFPKAVIPLTLMMFASVGIRVRHYGLTENRYYVLVFGAWVLGAMIYLITAKPKKSLVLPITLAIVVALAVIGPWSSFSVSMWSQNRRFETLLTKYGMLREGTIVHPTQPVPVEDRREFAEILFYFADNHRLTDVRFLPADFHFGEFDKVFGFQYFDVGFPERHKYVRYQSRGEAFDLGGYDYFFDFASELGSGPDVSMRQGPVEVTYNTVTWDVQVIREDAPEWRRSLHDYLEELAHKYGDEVDVELEPEDTVISDESAGLRVKLVITSLWADLGDPAAGKPRGGTLRFYLLVGVE